jgi:hypothetical protein
MDDRVAHFDFARKYNARALSQAYADKYAAPLNRLIRDQITPQKYAKYRAEKVAAIENNEQVPVIQVNTNGIVDPAHVAANQRAKESDLAKRLAEACGNPIIETPKPQRQTMDSALFALHQQTRFWNDCETGRRFYPVTETFESFDEFSM